MTNQPRFKLLCASAVTSAVLCWTPNAAAQADDSIPEWVRAPYLNVVLSIDNTDAMRTFYGDTLGLESLRDLDLPARVGRPFDTIMLRFRVGRSEIKMIPHENLKHVGGGHTTAAGLRTLSLPVRAANEGLNDRLRQYAGADVVWHEATGCSLAWIHDPDGNEIELRRYPNNAPEAVFSRLELGITTNNIEASRRHYGEWLGLQEINSVERPGYPGVTYQYALGDSVLRLWQPHEDLPTTSGWTKDGYGLRYVQFIVKDSYALHEKLRSQGATIAQEPTPLGSSTVLLFAADPDGVINECVGPARPAK